VTRARLTSFAVVLITPKVAQLTSFAAVSDCGSRGSDGGKVSELRFSPFKIAIKNVTSLCRSKRFPYGNKARRRNAAWQRPEGTRDRRVTLFVLTTTPRAPAATGPG
jgi:hypothetical protein